MAGQIEVVINQIFIFLILMITGFIAAKTNVVSKDALNALSILIVKIIIPALIFSIIAGSGVTLDEFMISGKFAIGVVLCYTLLIAVSIAMSRLCRLKDKTANIFIALATFGNMGFMGIPLIQALFKEPIAQVSISIYTIIDMALLWTLGVFLCSRHQQKIKSVSALKNMINPTTIALLSAFVIMAFRIPVPDLLMDTISGIGNMSKSLNLIYLGSALAYVSMGKALKKTSTYIIVLVKMLVLPVISYIFLGLFLQGIPRLILTLIVGLPSMTTIAMIAKAYDSDSEYATEVIFVTTIFSLLTIPAISFITSFL